MARRLYSTAQCAAFRTQLEEAEAALHKAQMGGAEVGVRMGEKQVQYQPADVPKLQAYVLELRSKVDICDGKCGAGRRLLGVIPTN